MLCKSHSKNFRLFTMTFLPRIYYLFICFVWIAWFKSLFETHRQTDRQTHTDKSDKSSFMYKVSSRLRQRRLWMLLANFTGLSKIGHAYFSSLHGRHYYIFPLIARNLQAISARRNRTDVAHWFGTVCFGLQSVCKVIVHRSGSNRSRDPLTDLNRDKFVSVGLSRFLPVSHANRIRTASPGRF